ncbi:hypothetical protein HYFRA_00003867 [Hymenoscyphus fraxineus]|uniref:Cytochrome P450 n=1 Tax=Hymenoscyphus fraxineus TaxID=746836 RepID=A0A9N9PR42_9HELO|nr:hypothetical protein HYFRA_00003867 [Hymenoscyphus fraxineus]
MAVEKALEQYGDVVRIAPNEIVFVDPRAASGTKTLRRRNLILHYLTKDTDIYGSHTKHLEHFTKTNFIKIGQGDQGIAWETDPVKHRNMVKKISPAFSMKSVRAKEPTMHKHIDHFVQIMKEVGGSDGGVELREVSLEIPNSFDSCSCSTFQWTDWLALDISAELAFSRQMDQLKQSENSYVILPKYLHCSCSTGKSSPFLEVLWGMNFFLTIHQVCRKFPLLSPIQFLFAPPSAVISELKGRNITTMEVKNRIKRHGKTTHLDHFNQILGDMDPESTPSKWEQEHLEVLAVQMIVAGYEPISSQFLCTIMFSLLAPETYKRLVDEIRMAFTRYEDITPEALAPLEYLNASLMETLRMTVIGGTGLPRISPGAHVNGIYVEKGVYVQYSHFAFTRSPRYFQEPRSYKPERWLPVEHPHWDSKFKNDARESFFPFSQGPRACPGTSLAWNETRLFIGKLLWSFDIAKLPNQEIVFERDFKINAMWDKPKFWVRLQPVARDLCV